MRRTPLLPWEYGVRNLLRRPGRSALTVLGLSTVVFLVMLVVAFLRGLEASLAVTGDPRTVLIHLVGSSENIENSSVPARTASLLSASIRGVQQRYDAKYVSPEIYLGTQVALQGDSTPHMAVVRGVTPTAPLVHSQFQLVEGDWPASNELIVGRLAAAKLGRRREDLAVGRTLILEGKTWRISGGFAARGSAFESEIWCPLESLQQAMKRQDVSLVAMSLVDSAAIANVEEFCKERLDLELQATPEVDYYAAMNSHYGPIRSVAWTVVALVASAGVFAGLNTMYGAVVGRVRELAALQTIGFHRRAIALSIVQEGALLAAVGSLLAAFASLALLNGASVRFTMGAFSLRVDEACLVIGCLTGLSIGVLGALPPAFRALRMPVVDGLKAI